LKVYNAFEAVLWGVNARSR